MTAFAGELRRHRGEAKDLWEPQLQHLREMILYANFLFIHREHLGDSGLANSFLASEASGNGHSQRQDSKSISPLVLSNMGKNLIWTTHPSHDTLAWY